MESVALERQIIVQILLNLSQIIGYCTGLVLLSVVQFVVTSNIVIGANLGGAGGASAPPLFLSSPGIKLYNNAYKYI